LRTTTVAPANGLERKSLSLPAIEPEVDPVDPLAWSATGCGTCGSTAAAPASNMASSTGHIQFRPANTPASAIAIPAHGRP
jgi:hypothetical protein